MKVLQPAVAMYQTKEKFYARSKRWPNKENPHENFSAMMLLSSIAMHLPTF